MLGGDHALHGDGAQIDELEIVARFQRFDRGRIEAGAETRRAVESPRNTVSRGAPSARASAGENSGSNASPRCFEHDGLAADHIDAGAVVLPERRELVLVAARNVAARSSRLPE